MPGDDQPEVLPPFKVTLTRLKADEPAFKKGKKHYEAQGQRTKLGGKPDWVQGNETPECPECSAKMSFVAQIDSIEHDWDTNPHAVDATSDDQKWMFGDVGMLYLFFCFDCSAPQAVFQCG
jgi:hypothetical protein